MSTTKLIPSRHLLRYLNENICNISVRSFCHGVTQQSSTKLLRRSILLRPPQQCRHIWMARIAHKTSEQKLQEDNHKLLNYSTQPIFLQSGYQSKRIILWRHANKRPNSAAHVFVGVMTIKDVMEKYLVQGEETLLDPGEGTSWMLVPRCGFQNSAKPPPDPKQLEELLKKLDATNLDEYLLVKRASWMVPKPGREVTIKGGRGNAKLINFELDTPGPTISVMLAKAYFFLETQRFLTEFHIHFSKRQKFSQEEMYERLMNTPCGLAFHPEVIKRQMPPGADLNIKPMSNGRELVWVVGHRKWQGDELVSIAKESLLKLVDTPAFIAEKGMEKPKDRNWRLYEERMEIKRLREEGKSFDHVSEQRRQIDEHEEKLADMFGERNTARRQAEKDSRYRRLQERLKHQAHKRNKLAKSLKKTGELRSRWERRKSMPRATQYDQEEREAMRAAFLAQRSARKTELRAKFMIRTVDYYTKPAQTEAESVKPNRTSVLGSSDRSVKLLQAKETARDSATRALLRSPQSPVRTILGVKNKKSLSEKRKLRLDAQRKLDLRRKQATSIRSKFEEII